jgi:thiamine monophosphate kinase
LCFTAPQELPSEIAGVALTPIGRITTGRALQLRDEQGVVDYRDSGYVHFQ